MKQVEEDLTLADIYEIEKPKIEEPESPLAAKYVPYHEAYEPGLEEYEEYLKEELKKAAKQHRLRKGIEKKIPDGVKQYPYPTIKEALALSPEEIKMRNEHLRQKMWASPIRHHYYRKIG